MQIGSVDFELFNKIVLRDLYLEDQSGATLFSAKRLAAGFEFLPLLKKKLIFSSAQLFTFDIHLNKETDEMPLNLQFILDAFAKKDTTQKTSTIDLNIHTLSIRRGHFMYHVKSAEETPGKFNPKHLDIKDLSAKLRLNVLTNDSLHVEIHKLSLKEQSGLEIKRLLFTMEGSPQQARINDFQLWLPQSHLQIQDIFARFPDNHSPDAYILESFLSFDIVESEIAPKDLAALVPNLSTYKDKITLEGHAEGFYDNIRVSDFELSNGKDLRLLLSVRLTNLSAPGSSYVDGDIKRFYISAEGLQRTINNFSSETFVLPKQLDNLHEIGFQGKVSGYFHNMLAKGDFFTEAGRLSVDVNVGKDVQDKLFIKGHLSTPELDLAAFSSQKQPYGKLTFQVDLDARQDSHKKLGGIVNANVAHIEFKDHRYKNIQFNGDFTHSSFNGKVDIQDDYGSLSAEGFVNIKEEISEYNFSALASNLKLDKLNLSKKHIDSDLSFAVDANMKGNTMDNLLGYVAINSLHFTRPGHDFSLDSLYIKTSEDNENRSICIHSDILHGEISGLYSYSGLLPTLKSTLHQYLPALIPLPEKEISIDRNFQVDLTINNTEKVSKAFDLPITIFKESGLRGEYNHLKKTFNFELSLPQYTLQKIKMEDTNFSFYNSDSKAELKIEGIRYGKFDVKTDFKVLLSAKENRLENLIAWKNREEALYEGELFATAQFYEQKKKEPFQVDIQLKPTHLVFKDTVWTVHPATIKIDDKITVDNLNVEHLDQYVRVNGVVSKDTADNLLVDLNKVNLDYIFNSLTIPALELGGSATGKVLINDVYGMQKLSTNLDVKDFSFNNATLGNLKLNGLWDNGRQGIIMTGDIYKNDTTGVNIDGIILPSKKELSIYFDAKNANGNFVQKYLNKVAPGFTGEVSGKLHLHGDFKNVTVAGSAMVRKGGFGIDFLNTYYTFNDSVYFKDDKISVSNLLLYDNDGHTAIADGYVTHDYFDSFNFQASIISSNFLVFNGTEKQNPTFFGTAYGTGNATISGTEDDIDINVSMRTNEKTKISLNFMEQADIEEYNFINFVSRNNKENSKEKKSTFFDYLVDSFDSDATIKMNLTLDATPDAQIEFYIDPISGDKIKAWGKGTMRIEYGNHIEPKIYGTYTVERGIYNFSLQQVIFRDFHIQEGSSLTFRGDPYGANLDIEALYSLSANLVDLDPSFALETPMSAITVNCLLNINGELEQPAIKFDLKLPHSTPDLERQVKNVISTEEMMNRQMIFLLALGRFYTQETTSTSSTNDFASVASSTLSSQLNSLLGNLNENFQIGTNIRTNNYEEYSDTEVKLLLSSQILNNRLIINGNFGYKDNPVSEQRFVGDFDLEYKLTKSGDIRLKAYNHYNDKYYYLKTTTKQGVGVLFRRDFDNLYDLFRINQQKKAKNRPPDESNADNMGFIHFRQNTKRQQNN